MNGKPNFGKQCNWITDNHGTIEFHYHGEGQSKDDVLRGRVEPDLKKEVQAFCAGRKISETDFVREYTRLGSAYFDLVDVLVDHADFIVPFLKNANEAIPILKRMAKIFAPVCSTGEAGLGQDCSTNDNEG